MSDRSNDATSATLRKLAVWKRGFLWAFGVVLPCAALGVELSTRLCREELFDPIPTPLHGMLVATVPFASLLVLFSTAERYPRAVRFVIGMALVVASVYALVFLPLTPIAVIAIVWMGLGLLALSPLLSLISLALAVATLRHQGKAGKLLRIPPTLFGSLAGLGLLAAPAILPSVIHYYLSRAVASDSAESKAAIQTLKRLPSREALLRACTQQSRRNGTSPLDFTALLSDVPVDDAGKVYYLVTGEQCRSRAETFADGTWERDPPLTAQTEDPEGPPVGRPLKLKSSRIDGSVDAAGAVGYLEWIWVVQNDGPRQAEGRAVVTLPAGAVVSRVSLWIDGEPREAAFAGKAEVKQAYEKVVSRRRDPLLVTELGPGRVQLRFFPVPSHGEMKLRLGWSAPLLVPNLQRPLLGLPRISERNFSLETAHQVWIESQSPFRLGEFHASAIPTGYRLDQTLATAELQRLGVHLEFDVPKPIGVSWTPDPLEPSHLITQRFEPLSRQQPARITLVLDTSERQHGALLALAQAMQHFPKGPTLSVVAADNDLRVILPETATNGRVIDALTRELRQRRSSGGTDSVPALTWALTQSTNMVPAVVLWLHGPQPVLPTHPERLRQILERAGAGLELYSLSTLPGQNRVLDELNDLKPVITVDTTLELGETISALFRAWAGAPQLRAIHERWAPQVFEPPADGRTSDHLTRLWARDEVDRLVTSGQRAQAIELAHQRQLVTSVSGAVVLENAGQYAEAKLTPAAPEGVPSVPEPAITTLLFCAVAALLFYVVWLRRQRPCSSV